MTNLQDVPGNTLLPEDAIALGATGLAKGAFCAGRASATTIASGVEIPFDTEVIDVSNWYSIATGIYTPLVAGVYRLTAAIRPNALIPPGDSVSLILMKNGANHRRAFWLNAGASSNAFSLALSVLVSSDGDDTFSVIYSSTVSPLNLSPAESNFFCGELVGRS